MTGWLFSLFFSIFDHSALFNGLQVDVFGIAETCQGATLRLQYHINWQGLLPDFEGVHNGASHVHIMKCHGDFLFIAHYNGLVSVWNWKELLLVHCIRYHSVPGQ